MIKMAYEEKGVDLGPLVGKAFENTLDAKGLTYAVKDANEIVMTVPMASDGTPDLSNTYFISDGEYQIHDIYVSDSHKPKEVAGNMVDAWITVKRNNEELLKDYRIANGINTLYGLHNGQKLAVTDMKFPDANDNPTATSSTYTSTNIYVHFKVLKLVPA